MTINKEPTYIFGKDGQLGLVEDDHCIVILVKGVDDQWRSTDHIFVEVWEEIERLGGFRTIVKKARQMQVSKAQASSQANNFPQQSVLVGHSDVCGIGISIQEQRSMELSIRTMALQMALQKNGDTVKLAQEYADFLLGRSSNITHIREVPK